MRSRPTQRRATADRLARGSPPQGADRCLLLGDGRAQRRSTLWADVQSAVPRTGAVHEVANHLDLMGADQFLLVLAWAIGAVKKQCRLTTCWEGGPS
jgi:hypothetical protein